MKIRKCRKLKVTCNLNRIIVAVAILSLLLIASFGFNVYSITTTAPPTTATLSPVRATFDDQRLLIQPKVKQNGTTIECQREFFLFHIDQVNRIFKVLVENCTLIKTYALLKRFGTFDQRCHVDSFVFSLSPHSPSHLSCNTVLKIIFETVS